MKLTKATEVKKPLSEEAIRQVRSALTLPEHVREMVEDSEIHLFAESLWHWWQHMKTFNRYMVSICDKYWHPAPIPVAECPEKLLLWVVRQLGQGRKIVAVGHKNKTVEARIFEWFSYFAPVPAV
ncbi:MAG: hypothetical protein AAB507_01125 [Patescibacteria group bacterium]